MKEKRQRHEGGRYDRTMWGRNGQGRVQDRRRQGRVGDTGYAFISTRVFNLLVLFM